MSDVHDVQQISGDPSSVEEVEKLVQQLYSPGARQHVSQIQDTLQRLQRADNGWQLADTLFHSEDEKVRFFGALTFTVKINSDWDTLRDEDRGPVLHRLLQWLAVRVRAGEGPLVVRKLCTSLAAYFLRPTITWNRCVLHLVCCLHQGDAVSYEQLMSSHDRDTSGVMQNLGRPQLLTALWFAVTLVEEVGKTSPASIQTYKYHDRLDASLNDVVSLLHTSLRPKPDMDTRIAEEGVKCFQAWVTYAHGVWIDKQMLLAPLQTLTPFCLQLLWHDDLSELIADCLGDILNPFSTFFTAEDLSVLVRFLISERADSQLHILLDGDFELEPMAIARLLLAYGDASIQDLSKNLGSSTVQIIMRELLQLLACEGFAGADDDICIPALEFWQSYTEFLIDSLYGADDQVSPWMEIAKRYVVQAIEHSLVKVRMPSEDVLNQWTSDAKGDFKAFRTDVVDLLQSSYTLLGTSIFDRLASLANEALQRQQWINLEATLFCLNALAESISDEDVVDATLSRLFGSELFVNMMDPTLAIPSKTQQTAVTAIISFTAFFERNTQFLPPMLTFLFRSLQVPALVGVAAKAIYSTCDSCRKSLVIEVGAFLHQYEILLEQPEIDSTTKEKVIGAIAAIIQAIPSTQHRVGNFARLIDFVSRDVEVCQELARSGSLEQAQERGLCALRCLINMGKSMQEPDGPAIDLENETLPHEARDSHTWEPCQERIVECLYAVRRSLDRDGEVIEASCQVLRTGYKETSPGPFVFPPKTTEDFLANSKLRTPRLECVLDTAGAMLMRHTRAKAPGIDAAATTFLVHLFHLISMIGSDPANEPEVSASCIDLAVKFIPHYLHIFLHPQYRDNIATFLVFTIQAVIAQEIMGYELPAEIQAILDSTLERYGPQVALVIIHGISGEVARSDLESLSDTLKKMVFAQPRAKQWLSDALLANTFPSSKVGEAEKRIFLQQVMSLRGSKKTNQVVKEFWMACRGTNFAYAS
ncbi:MAG: hypothetical protein Q9170_002753 [Blastenia crenularia]